MNKALDQNSCLMTVRIGDSVKDDRFLGRLETCPQFDCGHLANQIHGMHSS
jgi:hypothetical protein